ncbi:hypothetical protein PR202_gb16235 [Eleusine coracana subsp. coracana]|uniref:UBX domain-containing protein n=1 Tax=Eleusine coracana subsp. coracana TaxID=191504 RepID=A0AAV5F0J5_ELECO|nr:hypothetical protein PR202_gb16235 [Eleusine coracana subsp. coracana]
MERTVNSLAYKGSISDAINQSRQQKKLFVVYISGVYTQLLLVYPIDRMIYLCTFSGEDEASSSLEQSTLVDEHVVLTTLLSIMSSVSAMIIRSPPPPFKYFCLFKLSGGRSNRQMLHLLASQARECGCSTVFSYLFILKYLKPDPQKSVPSISVIGLNGVMLWHHEGHVISENLKESIEKAWAALHLQETAATLLTASLASRNAESVNTTSTALPHLQGSSTSENTSASSSQPVDISGASGVAHPTDLVSQLPSRTTHDEALGINEKEGSESVSDPVDRTVEKLDSACTEVKTGMPDSLGSSNKGSSSDPKQFLKRKNKVDGSCTEAPSEASPRTITGSGHSSQLLVEQDKATTCSAPDEGLNSVKSDDIHLSIRMPSGYRLEIKLTKQDVLREVKNFVDENLGSGVGSYDLSMIYPKRVFTEQGTGSDQWSHPGMESQEATQESRANTLRRRTRPFGANVHTLGSEEQSSSDDRNVFWNGNSTEFGGDDRK